MSCFFYVHFLYWLIHKMYIYIKFISLPKQITNVKDIKSIKYDGITIKYALMVKDCKYVLYKDFSKLFPNLNIHNYIIILFSLC